MPTTQNLTAEEAAWAVRDAVRANRRGPKDEWVRREWLIAVIDNELSNYR